MTDPEHHASLNSIPPGFLYRLALRFSRSAVLYFLVALLGTAWGLQYAMAKMVSEEDVPAIGALFTVHAVLAVGFLAYTVLAGKRFGLTRPRIAFFCVVALFGTIGQLGLELLVAHHVSAGELTLIVSLMPVFVVPLAALFRTDHISPRKIFGLVAGCAAAIAILLPSAFSDQGSDGHWIVLTFLVPLFAAIALVIMAKCWPKGLDAAQVATGNLVAGSVLLIPVTLWSGDRVGFSVGWGAGDWAVFGFMVTVAAEYYLMALLTRLSGAVYTSCSDFVAICAGLGWSYLFFAEVPTAWSIVAALFCMAALKIASDGVVDEARPQTLA